MQLRQSGIVVSLSKKLYSHLVLGNIPVMLFIAINYYHTMTVFDNWYIKKLVYLTQSLVFNYRISIFINRLKYLVSDKNYLCEKNFTHEKLNEFG